MKPRETTSTPVQAPAPAKANGSKNPGEYVLDYGKAHRGKTLAAIYAEKPDYLTWVVEQSNAKQPIKTAIQVFLTWVEMSASGRKSTTAQTPQQHGNISLSSETMKALLDGKYASAAPHAAAMVNLSKVLNNASTTDTVLGWANIYRGKREEGLEKEAAAAEADKFIREAA